MVDFYFYPSNYFHMKYNIYCKNTEIRPIKAE